MVERIRFDKANGNGKSLATTGAARASTMARGVLDQVPRVKANTAMGVSGVSVYGGYVRTTERNPDWVGTRKWQTIADMSVNVSIVAASVQFFLNMVAHPQWHVRPAEDQGDGKSSKEAEQLAEFVDDVINDMTTPWQRVVRRSAMYRFNGFGIQEWIAKKREDGKIGYQDIEPRPAFTIERWAIDDDGTVLGVWQRSPQTYELLGLPRGKLIYMVDDTYTDQPDGLGIYRMLAEPYNRLKQYLELEARAYERDMRGIPVGRAPITIIRQMVKDGRLTAEEGEGLLQGIRDFITTKVRDKNTSLLMDSLPYENQTADGLTIAGTQQWDVSLLSGGVSGLAEMAKAIERLQREMSRIIGTEHLMMGDQNRGGGSSAMAADKSRNLYLIANAVLANIADGMDHDLIDPLWSLNGFDPLLKPYFTTEDVAFKDAQEIASSLMSMAQAGAVLQPDDPAIDDVRDLLGISHAPELTPAQLGAMQAAPGAPGAPGAQPGAKKPVPGAPTPAAGANGKGPTAVGTDSPPQTDDSKQQQVAGTTDAQQKPKPKTVTKDENVGKYNQFHGWHGYFASGPGDGEPELPLNVANDNKPVPKTDPEAHSRIKGWLTRNGRQKIVDGLKEVGVKYGHEVALTAAVDVALEAMMPGVGFVSHTLASAGMARLMGSLAEKIGFTEHNMKEGIGNGIRKLIDFRNTQLTLAHLSQVPPGAAVDVTSGRVLTKDDNTSSQMDAGHADDAVLAYLYELLDAVNAYQPPRDPATTDPADATVHVNRLHDVTDMNVGKFNEAHDQLGRFASGDGSSGGDSGGDTGLTGTAKWERPTDANLKQEYKVEYQNHFRPSYGDVFPNEADFVQAVKDAPTVTVDRSLNSQIANRSNSTSMGGLLDLISGYRSYPKYRNEDTLKALADRIKTGKPVDMPIVTKDGNRMRVLSGNTRMDIGFMHNPTVKVVMLDVGKYRKYNMNHDELGRFASGPGGGGASSDSTASSGKYQVTSEGKLANYTPQPAENATELYNRTYDPSATPEQVMKLAGPDTAAKAAEVEAKLKNEPDTKTKYTDANGVYTDERKALHQDILQNGGKGDWKGFTLDAMARATPAPGEQPTLYVLGGRGGAGKSWFSKSPDSPFDASKTMYINNDDFKESLPEYQGWNAGPLHEEASDVTDVAYRVARDLGLNVTFDATMKSTGSIGKLIDEYEKAGYRVEGYFMHTAPQVSAVRAMGRFDHTGRYVPASYVLGSTTNEKSFDTMTPHFAKWKVYDNNSGSGPVMVAQGGGK